MNFGQITLKWLHVLTILAAAFTFAGVSQAAIAQEADVAEVADAVEEVAAAAPAFEHFGPDMIKGQPVFAEDDFLGSMTFQPQYTATGEYALWFHDWRLMPVIVTITIFVLGLLVWVGIRYNRRANPVPSKTSHNVVIEVIWTFVPIVILLVIAVPSIRLLGEQYESPPEDAVTIKAIGYQWYWGFEYVDNGGFEVISNMMPEDEAIAQGLPQQLAADNRMVVPVGEPIRIQTIGADVIHGFGIPSLWFKIDAVPGRINEKLLQIEEPGIYYGQCMELCGARHGYMPIAIEARTREDYEAWVLAQGGTVGPEVAIVDEAEADEPAEDAGDAVEAETEDAAAEA